MPTRPAVASAAVAAMPSNFFLNISSLVATGACRFCLASGLFTFYAICGLGTAANAVIVGYIFSRDDVWWLAGLAGVVIGSVWNYAVSSVFTWKQK
jgi:dolichol-phosphate mannosyltransferase